MFFLVKRFEFEDIFIYIVSVGWRNSLIACLFPSLTYALRTQDGNAMNGYANLNKRLQRKLFYDFIFIAGEEEKLKTSSRTFPRGDFNANGKIKVSASWCCQQLAFTTHFAISSVCS
jgi:hypothetical protein